MQKKPTTMPIINVESNSQFAFIFNPFDTIITKEGQHNLDKDVNSINSINIDQMQDQHE